MRVAIASCGDLPQDQETEVDIDYDDLGTDDFDDLCQKMATTRKDDNDHDDDYDNYDDDDNDEDEDEDDDDDGGDDDYDDDDGDQHDHGNKHAGENGDYYEDDMMT